MGLAAGRLSAAFSAGVGASGGVSITAVSGAGGNPSPFSSAAGAAAGDVGGGGGGVDGMSSGGPYFPSSGGGLTSGSGLQVLNVPGQV